MNGPPQYYEFGPFRLDPAQRLLLREGQSIFLPPRVMDVLLVLVESRGQVLSKDELMRRVWPETFVEEGNLGQNIFLIRKVLGSADDGQDYIRTLPKRGYCFVAEVKEVRERTPTMIVTEHTVSGILVEEETVGSAADIDTLTAAKSMDSPSSQKFRLSRLSAVWLLILGIGSTGCVALYLLLFSDRIGVQPAQPVFERFEVRKLTSTGASIEAAISPNGKYVTHVVDQHGSQSLWTRQTATPNDIQIVAPAEARYLGLTFSHDSDWIYFVRDSELFLVAALGGAPRKLLSGVASPVTLSPDGKQLAFVRSRASESVSSLIVFDFNSENERVLATRQAPSYYRSPAWSPNGRTIACSAGDRTGSSLMSLVEVDLDTGRERAVTTRQWASAGRVVWAAGGRGLLLAAGDRSRHSQIWFVSYPEGEVRAVTSNLINHRGLSLTGDSTVLLTTEHEQSTNIWVAPTAGASLDQITAGTGADDDPRWIPGGRLVFTSEAAGDRNVWMSDADGTGRKQLSFGPYRDSSPGVSPDGSYVVFSSSRGNTRSLWRVGIDGNGLKRLTDGVDDKSPSFSPDGKWVVFSRYAGQWETLWKVSADGGEALQLTDRLSKYPVVSPDGKFIACYYWDHQEGSSVQLAILEFEGGKPLKTFDTAALTILSPIEYRWTPDGRAVTYVVTTRDTSNIWSQDLAGGPPRQITSFKSDRILSFDWSRDGRQLVFSRGTRSSDVVLMTDSK